MKKHETYLTLRMRRNQSNGKIRVVIFEALNREQANQKLAEAKKLYRDAWILVP